MIIVIAGDKGGTGKTTLITNLAVGYMLKNKTVGLVAADNNQSLLKWYNRRTESNSPLMPISEAYKNIKSEVESMTLLADIVLVDTAGHDNEELRNLALFADQIIVPLRPSSQSEVDSLEKITGILNTAKKKNTKLKSNVLFNRCKTSNHAERLAIKEALESDDNWIQPFNSFVSMAQVFEDALNAGKSVYEVRTRTAQPKAQIDLIIQEIGV